MQLTRPGEVSIYAIRNSRPNFSRAQDGYFLFVYVKIATISKTVVSIICNSSYVLIIITLSVRLRTDKSTSPGNPVKYIILSMIKGSYFLQVLFFCKKYPQQYLGFLFEYFEILFQK